MTDAPEPPPAERRTVQCPNCCRRAPVTHRAMGLLFYTCELCLTEGSMPAEDSPPDPDARL